VGKMAQLRSSLNLLKGHFFFLHALTKQFGCFLLRLLIVGVFKVTVNCSQKGLVNESSADDRLV
jgi:hypothetical protein